VSVPPLPIPSEDTTDSSIDLSPRPLGGGRLPGVRPRLGATSALGSSPNGRRLILLRMVGKGGFGEVYEGRLETPGGLTRRVAIKLLRADVVDEDTLARTIDEAHLLSQLSHPTVVAVEDLIHVDDRIAIVSEYIEGVDLSDRLPLPAPVALEVIARVAEALHAAWTASGRDGEPLRIVHRDIKPSNIRLGPHGVVKLLDFGIARGSGERRVKTGSGLLVGSLGYVAPERWIGDQEGHPSDVYALGSVLLESLTDRPLMSGLAPVRQLAICNDQVVHDERVRKHIESATQQPQVAELLHRMLAWSPRDRPSAIQVASLARRAGRHLDGDGLLAWSGTITVPRTHWSTAEGTVLAETDRGFTVSTLEIARQAEQAREADPARTPAPTATGSSTELELEPITGGAIAPAQPAPVPREPSRSRAWIWVGVTLGGLAAVLLAVLLLGAGGAAAFLGGAFDDLFAAPSAQAGQTEPTEPAATDLGVTSEPAGTTLEPEPDAAPAAVDSTSDPSAQDPDTLRGQAAAPGTADDSTHAGSTGESAQAAAPRELHVVDTRPEPVITQVEPEPQPASRARPDPETAAVGPTGTVVVDGMKRVRLRGPDGVVPLGQVPVGTYTLEAGFDEGVWTSDDWTVRVTEGGTSTWMCKARFRRCVEVR